MSIFKVYSYLKIIINDKERKSMFRIFKQVSICMINEKELPI